MPKFICKNCKRPYPETGAPYRCPYCDGYFDFDGPLVFNPDEIETDQPGIWRYRHSFCLFPGEVQISLGEGNTPLLWDTYRGVKTGFKLESLNPSGSYKDRGSTVLISQLARRQVGEVVEDSSGNAGASFAAYAARAGLKAQVYVPESAAGPKRVQIEAYGAELMKIPGPRSNAARAVLEAVAAGKTYASHAYLPFGLPGNATLAYEIWETLRESPGTIICPSGHGGLLRGIVLGFQALQNAGLVRSQPYYVGVQAGACAPLRAAFISGMAAMDAIEEGPTVAEGVRVRWPSQVEPLLAATAGGKGEFVAIQEEAILPARDELARMGIYVEPTSALVWCAFKEIGERIPEPVILVMSGSGLKYLPS